MVPRAREVDDPRLRPEGPPLKPALPFDKYITHQLPSFAPGQNHPRKEKEMLALTVLSLLAPITLGDRTAAIDDAIRAIEPKLVELRRHLHANPELSNREEKTSALVAEQLKS